MGVKCVAYAAALLLSVVSVRAALVVDPLYVFESAGTLTVNVTKDDATAGPYQISYSTQGGTATNAVDYQPATGTLTLSNNFPSDTFDVTILTDSTTEGDEYFIVRLLESTVLTEYNVTIVDAQGAAITCLAAVDTVNERDGSITIDIVRPDTSLTGPLSLNLATTDVEAVAGSDYTGTNVTVDFADGVKTMSVNVAILDDAVHEMPETETFTVTVSGDRVTTCIETITINDDDAPILFHCDRGDSQQCDPTHGTCDPATGKCECTGGDIANDTTTGADCSRFGVSASGSCLNDCSGNGVCVAGVCDCFLEFAGDDCSQPAYFGSCTANGFAVCLEPYGYENFVGLMYVSNTTNTTTCGLESYTTVSAAVKTANGLDWCRGHIGVFSYMDATCGPFLQSDVNSIKVYQLEVRIQYYPDFGYQLDELVSVICRIDEGNNTLYSQTTQYDADDSALPKQTIEQEFSAGTFLLTMQDGSPIIGPVAPTDTLKGCVSTISSDSVNCTIIYDITVNNTLPQPDYREVQLLLNRCPVANTPQVTPVYEPVSQTTCFDLRVLILDTGIEFPRMGVVLRVGYPPDCHTDAGPICSRRKKRQTTSEGEAVGLVVIIDNRDSYLNFLNTTGLHPNNFNNPVPVAPARSMLALYLCLTIGGAFLLVVVIVLAYVAFRRHRRRDPAQKVIDH